MDIFRAVSSWSQANPGQGVEPILAEIRLSLFTINDLLKVVRPTELIPADVLLDAIQVPNGLLNYLLASLTTS